MPHHLSASPTVATFAACLSAASCWAGPASARCANFKAAGVPFFACTRGWAGGFLASEGGQRSVIAPRLEGQDGAVFALSKGYSTGVRVGPWTPGADFQLTLRLDETGPFRGKLTAEFCASRPVPVIPPASGVSRLGFCGDRMIVMEGLEWPGMAANVPE